MTFHGFWKKGVNAFFHFLRMTPGLDNKNLSVVDRIMIYLAHVLIAFIFLVLWLVLVYR